MICVDVLILIDSYFVHNRYICARCEIRLVCTFPITLTPIPSQIPIVYLMHYSADPNLFPGVSLCRLMEQCIWRYEDEGDWLCSS